jgi:hypothetical protein
MTTSQRVPKAVAARVGKICVCGVGAGVSVHGDKVS